MAQTFVHQSTRADHVYHISWDGGSIYYYVELDAEADPTSLAVAPAVLSETVSTSLNNRDDRRGDWEEPSSASTPSRVWWMGLPMGRTGRHSF